MSNSEKTPPGGSSSEGAPGDSFILTLGWVLFLSGLLVLLAFSVVHAIVDPGVPLAIRSGLGLFGLGSIVILSRLLMKRAASLADDPYRKVIR